MTHQQLAPGVQLHVMPIQKFKTNQIAVSFIMPLDETLASHATLLSMVLKTGCTAYPNVIELGKALDTLYGARLNVLLRKKGDNHLMTFLLEFLDPIFANGDDLTTRALKLLDQILFEPLLENDGFSLNAVDREKKNLCDLIDARINDKRIYALRRCGELTAQGQPYEAYECGNKDIVENIDAKGLYAFYKDYLRRATIEIFAFGRVEAQCITEVFSPRFSADRRPECLTTDAIPVGDLRYFEENYPVEQAKLSMGFCFDGKIDPIVQRLFVILYGGSASSLLFMNVREKLSLCYYCSAMLEAHKNMMIVYSGVMPEKIEAAKTEIMAQLDAVRQGCFTHEELSAAKKTYINSLRSMSDSMGQIEDYSLSQMLLGLDVDIEGALSRIEQIQEEDIQAVAKTVTPVSIFVLKGGDSREKV